jgi:hypothetical protein
MEGRGTPITGEDGVNLLKAAVARRSAGSW